MNVVSSASFDKKNEVMNVVNCVADYLKNEIEIYLPCFSQNEKIIVIDSFNTGPGNNWNQNRQCRYREYHINLKLSVGYYPCQIIYQFAHEIAHIYIGSGRDSHLIETICHKNAFDVLEDIGHKFFREDRTSCLGYIEDIRKKSNSSKKISCQTLSLPKFEKYTQDDARSAYNYHAFQLKKS